MVVVFLTIFTMIAFASNSILTRLAVEGGFIDPLSFAILRGLSGAVVLAALVLMQRKALRFKGADRLIGATSLAAYMIGFSMAYITLNAGLGALILFGVVQITMFLYSACIGERATLRQIVGASIAFAGLSIALWPGAGARTDPVGAAFMVLAGVGWAAYTLSGKSTRTPLAATASNFCICLPILAVLLLPFVETISVMGILLAVICGGLTSGLGYALWYRVLPNLPQGVAPVVQLSVPIIAIVAGALLLGEALTQKVLVAALLVTLGIGLAVTSRSAPADRS